jgi:2-phospho-L-lactate guanylyltransferase
MSCWALVAIKAPAFCKTRLAPVFPAPYREELARLMLTHVLGVLRDTAGIDRIAVVGPQGAWQKQGNAGIHYLPDTGRGLNACIDNGIAALAGLGARKLVVLHADLPMLEREDVEMMIAAIDDKTVAVAPDRHARGTNGLALALPSDFRCHFGADSHARHRGEASYRRLECHSIRTVGLGFDLDDAQDWAMLQQSGLAAYAHLQEYAAQCA